MQLNEVGARSYMQDGTWMVDIGIYLPGIRFADGYELIVRVIHEMDQFTPGIEPEAFYLTWRGDHPYDLWETTIELAASDNPDSHFGQPGMYFYRYQLLRHQEIVTFWFADPFGRMAGPGNLSAFEVGAVAFQWEDAGFVVPEITDLVVYELMVDEFNHNFDGVIARLDYLKGLGINAIEFMPLTNIAEPFRWGYMPISFFAPEDRYGGAAGMRRLVNECHKQGIAVIVDAVYAHAHPDFAYNTVYTSIGLPNPMMGRFAEDGFGLGTDFTQAFTREFFQCVNQYWLDEYHIDGFRYDYVPGYFDGPTGVGYAALVYATYQYSKPIARFANATVGYSRIIQCAEHLPDPKGIVSQTYSNSGWQNALLDKVEDMATHRYVDDRFAHLLDLRFQGYPDTYHNPTNGDEFPVTAFQYIEPHDHSRLITRFGTTGLRDAYGELYGDRDRFWFKLQPFVIALYTCQGVPMLWQGQEFAENYAIPYGGLVRVLARRPLRWEFFYDRPGKALVRLYRLMGQLRHSYRALRSRDSFYYNQDSRPHEGVIVYRRTAPATAAEPAQMLLVCINFSDQMRTVSVPFEGAGVWRELIDGQEQITVAQAGQRHSVTVPSNYGKVFVWEPA